MPVPPRPPAKPSGARVAVETDSCSRLSSGPQRSTPCARTCEYGSSCGERDFAEVNKDLEMGERRDRPEQRPHTRKTRSPGNGAWFWKAEALRMGSDFQDERRLLRTPKKGQMCPARPRHVTKAERLGDGGLVRFCSRGTCFPSPRPALLGCHRTRPAHGDSEQAACLSCHVGLLRTRSVLRRRPAWLPCAEGLGGTRRRLCRELGGLSRLV
ncbi:uncharacterized protein LOC118609963 isoform X2 [Rousettus aegyptiacus]|uniref:uncharacterized protein LOC118609963 isoform X2 n=1 Tax=Rousettus aegyptiacus TaxID=9407 RepID=UPI00168D5EF3|nr:uncharacterized protein LOC118609963 isoform X2 [Rousettus aegyptiacus]